MTDKAIELLAEVIAAQAEIYGMAWDNYARQVNGNTTFNYSVEDFQRIANDIQNRLDLYRKTK